MTRKWQVGLGVVVLVALGSSLAWALAPEQVAARLRSKMNSQFKTSNLQVKVVPYSEADSAKGRYKLISVKATSVIIEDVRLAPVDIQATDVTLDLNKLTRSNRVVTLHRGGDRVVTRVTERDLNLALAHKDIPIQNLKVQLSNGLLIFTGTYRLGLGANLRLEGALECPDKYKINFIPKRASVSGVPLPAGPLRTLMSKLNPMIDMRKVPLSPRVHSIRISGGQLVLNG